MKKIKVIGGGLAGPEAALQAASLGCDVTLYEMRPHRSTEAHETANFAELVCSNSLKSESENSAPWLLKQEMRRAGSFLLSAADDAAVPAGHALAVDRVEFSARVQKLIDDHPRITVVREEVTRIDETDPDTITILASGPLTSPPLAAELQRLTGAAQLAFYDSIAPIVDASTIDMDKVYFAARWDKGTADYINCPFTKEEYEAFLDALTAAETVPAKEWEHIPTSISSGREDSFASPRTCHPESLQTPPQNGHPELFRTPSQNRDPELFRTPPQNCHPERSEAESKDLRLNVPTTNACHSERSAKREAEEPPHSAHIVDPPIGEQAPSSGHEAKEGAAGFSPLKTTQPERGFSPGQPTTVNYFEGCLPIEETARRGRDTLRFGPMKPAGLTNPKTGRWPYAVVQLRQENLRADSYNLVGFQNHLKYGEQARVLRMIPGLENAKFLRYGQIHRNTYVNAPKVLTETLQLKQHPNVLIAGQLSGVEGYTESIAGGLLAGRFAAAIAKGKTPTPAPRLSANGSLTHYITHSEAKNFQPANITFDLLVPLEEELRRKIRDKKERHRIQCERALEAWKHWLSESAS